MTKMGKLGYLLMLASVIVLAATGIITFVFGHPPLRHWVLMLHVSAAPAFAIGLAMTALYWAEGNRFGCAGAPCSGLTKALFWFVLASGLVVILAGVVPMTPLFGTDGQYLLYLTHRYSAIVFAIAVVLHFANLVRGGKRAVA